MQQDGVYNFRSLTVAASLKVPVNPDNASLKLFTFPQPNGCGLIEGFCHAAMS